MDHHLVPQFYLRGFRDTAVPERQGPHVWVAYLDRKRIGLRSPKGLASRTNYYAVRNDAGDPDHRVETTVMQRIDSVAASVFADVRSGDYVLDQDRRGSLALFIAIMVTRLPNWREAVERFAGEAAASIMAVAAKHPEYFERLLMTHTGLSDTAKIEEIRRSVLEPGNYSFRGTPELSLRQMAFAAIGLSEVITRMSWCFLRAPSGMRFVTNDNPVHWNDPEAAPPLNAGLASRRTVLSFPMTPTVCLMASWHRSLPPSREAPPNIVDVTNQRSIQFADEHVYAASREDAAAALAHRDQLKAAGEPIGPRAPDLRVLSEDDRARPEA